MSKKPLIDLVNITKSFDDTCVLDDLNLSIKENEFFNIAWTFGVWKDNNIADSGRFCNAG